MQLDEEMKIRIAPREQKTQGTCQICWMREQQLRILTLGNFLGWVCPVCFRQLKDTRERLFIDAGEWTEPAE